jgi:hypothetical protein
MEFFGFTGKDLASTRPSKAVYKKETDEAWSWEPKLAESGCESD